jgi:hypothetical protein
MSPYSPSVSDVRRAIRGGNASFAASCCLLRRCSVQAMNYGDGTSLICHTQLRSNAAEEQNPTACALINAAYLRGAKLGMTRNEDSGFDVIRILVVGIDTAAGIRGVPLGAYFRCSASRKTRCKPVNEKMQGHMIKLFGSAGGQCHAA